MSDYLRYAFETLTEPPQLDRRDFLKQFGAGIVILISLGDLLRGQDPGRRRGTPQDFNAFLRIAEDGSVTGFTGKAELGQGVTTAMAQLLAEELDAPVASITMVMGDTDLCPWDMGTFGSMSVRFLGPVFRQAAAEARAVLVALAVEALGADAAELVTRDGAVMVAGDESRRIGYGELARGQAIHRVIEGEAAIQDAREYTVVGRDHLALESRAKVTGAAVYSGDVRRPGMLYARIVRPPAHDSTLESVDTAAAEARPGVRVVRDGDLIAVLHATPDGAAEALAAVRARWTPTRMSMDTETIFDHLMERAPAAQAQDEAGDPAAAEARAAHVEAVEYRQGYVAHAPMETHTAVAEIADGKVTVWASTQTPFSARDEVARALGRAPEEVRVIPPFVGGGFGGKGQNPQVVEAARLAELAGAPVHLEWTRAEEFFHDTFQPAAVVRVRSGVSAEGRRLRRDARRGGALPRARPAGRGPRPRLARRARHAPLRHRRLARARRQHQRLRPRVADRPHGRRRRHGPAGVPPPQPRGRADARGARRGRRALRMEAAGRGRRRPRHRLHHRRRHLERHDGAGPRRPRDRARARRARGLRPGHGAGGQPARRHDPGRGLHHHGVGLRPERGAALPRRRGARRQLPHLPHPALLLGARDRGGVRRHRHRRAARRRRARHRRHGRRHRQRHRRRDRRPPDADADDAGEGPRGPRRAVLSSGNLAGIPGDPAAFQLPAVPE
jgi:hypothetical protein